MPRDNFTDAMVSLLTDPHARINQLKRPAKRKCLNCGEQYISRVTLLAEPNHGCCSPQCDKAYHEMLRGIVAESRDGKWQ